MKSLQTYDVYLLSQPHAPRKGDKYEMVCTLEDGYAAFLSPLFALVNEEAGTTIVYIDWAHFGGDDLKWLEQVVTQTRQLMSAKPEFWNVLLGHDGNNRALYDRVNKYKMNALLGKVDKAIQRAREAKGFVSINFWGRGG